MGIDFKPLGYNEPARARPHLPLTVPLDWVNARVTIIDAALATSG